LDFPVLNPFYNVSGVERSEVLKLSLAFTDGAMWDFLGRELLHPAGR
jgi:hypothetical protein